MNAKEISDSTLESVTPADNDLLIIYDTSEGTTGKATIADIAPKVAENIDISTLPAVTPAANDVLMIGDTSEGTTGKATIADIAPKVAENIDIATLPAVTPAADDVLMIRDTSAGTTGKATIADIAPKVAENIPIINGTLTYSPTNAGGISEVFAKKYGRIAVIHAIIENCNLVSNTLTEIAITNLIPLNKKWQLVNTDLYLANLNPRCFLQGNGSIVLLVGKSVEINVRIDCVFLCE